MRVADEVSRALSRGQEIAERTVAAIRDGTRPMPGRAPAGPLPPVERPKEIEPPIKRPVVQLQEIVGKPITGTVRVPK